LIDKLADDIEGIIERIRTLIDTPRTPKPSSVTQKEFHGVPHSYSDVDFISDADVIVKRKEQGRVHIFCQVDFIERLFVQSRNGRIEFGVRRAYLSLETDQTGRLHKTQDRYRTRSPRAYYVNMHEAKPGAITICMEPSGKASLTELSVPVAEGENRYGLLASADGHLGADNLFAELTVSLIPTDLMLVGERAGGLSASARAKIEAIMTVAATKAESQIVNGRIKRTLEITEGDN
jgi:hypothetical protein